MAAGGEASPKLFIFWAIPPVSTPSYKAHHPLSGPILFPWPDIDDGPFPITPNVPGRAFVGTRIKESFFGHHRLIFSVESLFFAVHPQTPNRGYRFVVAGIQQMVFLATAI